MIYKFFKYLYVKHKEMKKITTFNLPKTTITNTRVMNAQKLFYDAIKDEAQRKLEKEIKEILAWQKAQPKGERRKFKFDES